MPMPEIRVSSFTGMNNIKAKDNFWSNAEARLAEPRLVVNADVSFSGNIRKRSGETLFLTLAGAHSLWAGTSCMLVAAAGKLYRIEGKVLKEVTDISGPEDTLSYEEVDDKVYISNPWWNIVYSPGTDTVTDWGIALPNGPALVQAAGAMPVGTYHVTMTNVVNDDISGNGPITSIELTVEGGIQILNRPAGALVWVTDENEGIFYLAGAVDMIMSIPSVEPLPTFLCNPPPNMSHLCFAFGRMWGASGSTVYYSEPFETSWFKSSQNKFEFDDEVTLIARVSTGMFFGLRSKTIFMLGNEPEQMQEQAAGAGSIPGTLVYANNLPELGDVLGTPEKGFVTVPVWRTSEGIVAGNVMGRLYNLTKHKLRMGVPERGASLYRSYEGLFQFLTSSKLSQGHSGTGAEDTETTDVFKNSGIIPSDKARKETISKTGFTDEAICEVYRNGVLIP